MMMAQQMVVMQESEAQQPVFNAGQQVEGRFSVDTQTIREQTAGSKSLYIVNWSVSSGNFIDESKRLDDKRREVTYTFPEDVRQKIQACRERYLSPIRDMTLDYHKKLHICGEDSREEIQKLIDKCDVDIKKIHPRLRAEVQFFPLDMKDIFKGTLYAAINDSIKKNVYQSVFLKINKIISKPTWGKKEMPEKTKDSLRSLLMHLDQINVTRDKDITKQIEVFREQIEKEDLVNLAKTLKDEIDVNKSRWSAIEL